MMKPYNPQEIEPKWQHIWEDTGLYRAGGDPEAPDWYQLTMFPYPSGDLHVGHWYAFTGADVLARFHRMHDKNVLFPMGWDAFGLPAENAAIKRGIPPAEWTRTNIASMKQQMSLMGGSFDWERELSTAEPDYYQWTQWLFLLLYKNGLAYREKGWQYWCPSCQTVLANEQVVGEEHLCERCDTPVEKKELEQWFFKITDYAEELLEELEDVDWPERIKTMQRNWIGKSEGALIQFQVADSQSEIQTFTTRPDTLFGATYMVLAPEHPLVGDVTIQDQRKEVTEYVKRAQKKSTIERQEDNKAKTGVFTGAYAINPINQEKLPIWVADYVLMEYGSGAIMAVPAHDQRDYEFVKQHDLPIKVVIEPITGEKQDNPQFRHGIVAVVENEVGELLTLNWGDSYGGHLFIGGGMEDGENAEDCARREIKEETGYQNVELISRTETVHHNYFAKNKGIAREMEAVGLHFKLVDDAQGEQDLEAYERDKFSLKWLSQEEAQRRIQDPLHHYVFERLLLDRVYTGEGKLTGSDGYDGLDSEAARSQIVKALKKQQAGEATTQYKLRDWLISRQRYWGAPIPMVYCERCGLVPVPEAELPVTLPEDVQFEPTGKSPLKSRDDFVNTVCPECKAPAQREVDTMDTFVDSSWYFLRFPDPQYQAGPFNPEAINRWLPVDHYTGGIEHAILHLLYARFITKVLRDYADLGFSEPFQKLSSQGLILGPDGHKMSKSRGNVINPDEVIASGYGADAFRSYMLFIGPWTEGGPFSTEGLTGTYRFLNRVWKLVGEYKATEKAGTREPEQEAYLKSQRHRTIKKVTEDIESLQFNTAIAALMEYVNTLYKVKADMPPSFDDPVWSECIGTLLQLLAPFAPHLCEELWSELGNHESIHIQSWPEYEEASMVNELVTLAVQINGKTRDRITITSGASEDEAAHQARQSERVAEALADKEVVKTIVIPDKLVNFVVK